LPDLPAPAPAQVADTPRQQIKEAGLRGGQGEGDEPPEAAGGESTSSKFKVQGSKLQKPQAHLNVEL
jgi:hypothetical protein